MKECYSVYYFQIKNTRLMISIVVMQIDVNTTGGLVQPEIFYESLKERFYVYIWARSIRFPPYILVMDVTQQGGILSN